MLLNSDTDDNFVPAKQTSAKANKRKTIDLEVRLFPPPTSPLVPSSNLPSTLQDSDSDGDFQPMYKAPALDDVRKDEVDLTADEPAPSSTKSPKKKVREGKERSDGEANC